MAYKLEGSLLEVCNCEVLCPCWIGVDPDRELAIPPWRIISKRTNRQCGCIGPYHGVHRTYPRKHPER